MRGFFSIQLDVGGFDGLGPVCDFAVQQFGHIGWGEKAHLNARLVSPLFAFWQVQAALDGIGQLVDGG
jgi:hypothetical protein